LFNNFKGELLSGDINYLAVLYVKYCGIIVYIFCFFIKILAEMNRSPTDLVEAESGFNI